MSYGPNVFPTSAEDLARILSTPNVWKPVSVEKSPEVVLHNWTVYECLISSEKERTRHLVGSEGTGRVSSKVVDWRLTENGIVATTKSGRKYFLAGSPGSSADGHYVWGYWAEGNEAQDIVDVTEKYWDYRSDTPMLPMD